jgi:hypothetical protein
MALALVSQSLHETIGVGMEATGVRRGTQSTDSLLRRRLRDPECKRSREPPANPTLRCIGKRYRRIKVATRDWAERENQRDQCCASPVLQVSMGTHFSGLAILEVLPTFENLMQASLEQP